MKPVTRQDLIWAAKARSTTTAIQTFTSTDDGLAPASGGGTANYLRADGTWVAPPAGTGTVTSVSVTTANGVSGSVATATTTPAISLTLGAITPASVAAVGAVSGSNLSGTNTGDQTNISGNAATVTTNANLTGPITSVGNATTIADAELAALAGLTSAADKGIQFTGAGSAATYDLTTAGKALLDDADATAQRTTLGLGTLATQSGTFSGTHSGTSSGTNTGDQTTVSGNAGTVTVADAASDTTTWVLLGTSQTGSLAPATDSTLTYNASTNTLTTDGFFGKTAKLIRSDSGTQTVTNNGSLLGGYSYQTGGGAATITVNPGYTESFATAIGRAYADGASATATISATGDPSFVFGDAYCFGGDLASLTSSGYGSASFASTYSYGSASAQATATASGQGAFLSGYAESGAAFTASLLASSSGSFLNVYAAASTATTAAESSAFGTFASGAAVNGTLKATSAGAAAIGYSAGTMLASGVGSAVIGNCTSTRTLSATALGSVAMGYATGGNISATANNAVQLGGIGTNATASSLQVGVGVLLSGLTTVSSAMATGTKQMYVAKTGAYTLTAGDYIVNCTSGTFALTLPTAVGRSGQVYYLKNAGTGVITLNTTSAQTIDASASGAITLNQWDCKQVCSDGANWLIIGHAP